jgi:hypothetical protein
MKNFSIMLILLGMHAALHSQPYRSDVWSPDSGNGKYKNPVIFADYSDPDV